MLAFDVQPEPVINADVLVGDPHQREKRNHITPPVWEHELETRDGQKRGGHVMAQAVLAGKEIKQFALEPAAAFALTPTEFLKFAKHCFVSKGPGDAGHRDGQDKESKNLLIEGHAV